MTNQKYKIGDKVLVEAEFCGTEALDGNQIIVIPSGLVSYAPVTSVSPEFIRPYTPKPEFEYGEEVEVCDDRSHDCWERAIFLADVKGSTYQFRCVTLGCEDYFRKHGRADSSGWIYARKLQPKKELIEINGKKYDAEKVKERLAGLKAEE